MPQLTIKKHRTLAAAARSQAQASTPEAARVLIQIAEGREAEAARIEARLQRPPADQEAAVGPFKK